MNREEIEALINRVNNGLATDEDIITIESLIERGSINMEDIPEMKSLDQKLEKFEYGSPSPNLDARFYDVLAKEKKASGRLWFSTWFNFSLQPALTFGVLTFVVGITLGYLLFHQPGRERSELQALSTEVSSLKEMMMLTLLEKESATERLRAVNLTQELGHASSSVTSALIATLNKDENVNVRLAALDALRPYTGDSNVRTEIIRSIARQESPMVQVALAELMAALQERSSVKEFKKLLENEQTPEDVKQKIREKIDIMI